jgi:hypothetical protein
VAALAARFLDLLSEENPRAKSAKRADLVDNRFIISSKNSITAATSIISTRLSRTEGELRRGLLGVGEAHSGRQYCLTNFDFK